MHLIGLIHDEVREHFAAFVSALGLAEDRVFVFEHTANLEDTRVSLIGSAQQLLMSMTMVGSSLASQWIGDDRRLAERTGLSEAEVRRRRAGG